MKKIFCILFASFVFFNTLLYAEAMVPGEMAPPTAPSEDDGGDEHGNIRSAILDKISALLSQLDQIQTTEGGDSERVRIVLEIDSLVSELSNINTQINNTKSDSINNSENKLSEKNTTKAGDPVKVSVGSYVQNETDISSRLLEIKRMYDSENSIVSSIGHSWIFNLDQRIILGIEPMAGQKYEMLQNNYRQIKEYESSYEQQVLSNLHISNFDEGIEKINNKLQKAYSIEDEAKELDEENKDNTDPEDINRQAINELLGAVSSKISKIRCELDDLEQSIEELERIHLEAENLGAEILNYKNTVLDKSNERKTRNKKVMFKGSQPFFEETGLETLTIIDEEGNPHILYETKSGSGVWKNPEDKQYISCNKIASGFIVYEANGFEKYFDTSGCLIKVLDRNKNSIVIRRHADEKIKSVETSFGEEFVFTYSGSLITKIENKRAPEENVLYAYEDSNLVQVTDTDGDSVSMEYNNGLLVSLKKCDGSCISFTYGEQTSDNKFLVTETTNEEGFSERFEYNRSQNYTVYMDHDGNISKYFYDSKHRPLREIKPDGSEIKKEYDIDGNLASLNENGNIIKYKYDVNGNRISAHYKDGSAEYWSYDNYNLLTSFIDRDGVKEEYCRDSNGNIIEFKRGGKSLYQNEYDSKGQIIRKTVYGQNPIVTIYEYDSYGNLKSEICAGVKVEYDYDTRNRISKKVIAGKVITEIEYKENKVIQKNFNGLESTFVKNSRKDLVKLTQKDTLTGTIHEKRIEYDKRHLPLRMYIGDGNEERLLISFLYTPAGKILAEIHHGKETWIKLFMYKNEKIFEFKQFKINTDIASDQTCFTEENINDFLQASKENVYTINYGYKINPGNTKIIHVTCGNGCENIFEYDCYGNVIKRIDGNGEVSRNAFSKAGRLLGEETFYGGWYQYEYDSNGMLSARGEENGKKIITEYFPDGNIKSQTDRYGIVTLYYYDNRGRVKKIQNKTKDISFEYDSFDRIIKRYECSKVCLTGEESSDTYCVEYDYDADARSVTTTEGGKYKTVEIYDAFNNLIRQIKGNTYERSFVYNANNQLIESYDGYGNPTCYEYNALGLIEKIVRPEGESTVYSYNYMGLLAEITDACGVVYKAEYDKSGKLVKEKNRAESEKSYKYDNGGRLTEIICGGEIQESYKYEEHNRYTTVIDGELRQYHYKYDAFGRLIEEVNRNNLQQEYTYDENGLLKTEKNFDSSDISIKYSDYHTKRNVEYSDGSNITFITDAFGNAIEGKNAYGKINYVYDSGGKLIRQLEEETGDVIFFEYDEAGNRIKLKGCNRELSYTYGKNNEIKEIFDNQQRLRIKLEYNKNGREVLRKFGNGTREQTLYDKADRVIAKLHKTERGELLWGEGYIYGDDGKRIATVNNSGYVTLYEYNKKGQLETVYYPYSKEASEKQKAEAELNGLVVTGSGVENKYLSSAIKTKLIPIMNSMQYGLSFELKSLYAFIKESYTYDKNGNRKTKTTPFGTIEYTYDKENCLLASGSNGDVFIEYSYDKMGNLLNTISKDRIIKYAYNSQNRLIYCEQTDNQKKTVSKTSYVYDSFGRRILVQDEGNDAIRTVYDGLSFDVIKQSPVFSNGLFTDINENGINWGKTGIPTGDRYRYISEENRKNDTRYTYIGDENYKTENTRYYGERFPLIHEGKIAAQFTAENGAEYFSTDLLGSISLVTDSSGGNYNTYSYDVFGNLIQGELSGSSDFGYLSKQLDAVSGLYNYGYRDYSPAVARFTTLDPIRDGNNWFAYCNNDPVNFVDLWGLELVFIVNKTSQMMTVELNCPNYNKRMDVPVTTHVVSDYNENIADKNSNVDITRVQKTKDKQTNPTQFPNGTANITSGVSVPSKYNGQYGDGWLTTDANQNLPATDGSGNVNDSGYFIHYTSNTNTNGCIGVKNMGDMEQIMQLYELNTTIGDGKATIIVKKGEQK